MSAPHPNRGSDVRRRGPFYSLSKCDISVPNSDLMQGKVRGRIIVDVNH
jgi:hypothetical protein